MKSLLCPSVQLDARIPASHALDLNPPPPSSRPSHKPSSVTTFVPFHQLSSKFSTLFLLSKQAPLSLQNQAQICSWSCLPKVSGRTKKFNSEQSYKCTKILQGCSSSSMESLKICKTSRNSHKKSGILFVSLSLVVLVEDCFDYSRLDWLLVIFLSLASPFYTAVNCLTRVHPFCQRKCKVHSKCILKAPPHSSSPSSIVNEGHYGFLVSLLFSSTFK